jgi:hypothetical protein
VRSEGEGEGEGGADAVLPLLSIASISSGAKLCDRIRVYSCVVKSLRSTLSASPGIASNKGGLIRSSRGARGPPFDRALAGVTHLVQRGVRMP